MNQRKRIAWIDNSKGIGIILVIIGHIISKGILHEWIFSFHMPLFFFLSGYVFKKDQSLKTLLTKKVRTLLIPYFCLGIIIVLWSCCSTNVNIYENISKLILQKRTWTIWFLTSLFLVNIIYFVLLKQIKNKYLVTTICFFLFIGATFYYDVGGNALIWNADTLMVTLLYFHLGYSFKESKISEKFNNLAFHSKCFLILLLFVSNLTCVIFMLKYYGISLNMYDNLYSNFCLVLIGSITGIFFIISFSHIIKNAVLEYLGRNTILYFALHQSVFMPLVIVYISPYLLSHLNIAPHIWYWQFFKLFLLFALMTISNEIINRTKLRIILGKF